jgi:uncharacterized membrane protein
VLFFSPTCGHCEFVINDVLPPLFDENGGPWEVYFDEALVEVGIPFYLLDNGSLQFLLVDVSVEAGSALFMDATDEYGIDSNGVPRMIISEQVYIGSADIPNALPGLVANGLSGEGIDWPDFPGVPEAVASVGVPVVATTTTIADDVPTGTTTAAEDEEAAAGGAVLPTQSDSWSDRFGRDVVGNSAAVIVLAGLLASLAGVLVLWRRPWPDRPPTMAIPILAILGAAVAGYLSYIETSGAEAVCGPVGDCNTVQQSEYAQLFGIIPIGVLGLIGYVVVVGAWLVARRDSKPRSDMARVALLAGTVGGVAFSTYLTFLEPFVIGATCAWCLTSAVIITVLMWLALGPAAGSWSRLRAQKQRRAGIGAN